MSDIPASGPTGQPAITVDARGRRCPLPVIDLARAAEGVPDDPTGTLVEVWADDPAAATDIPAWCRMRGQTFLGSRAAAPEGATAYTVLIRRC